MKGLARRAAGTPFALVLLLAAVLAVPGSLQAATDRALAAPQVAKQDVRDRLESLIPSGDKQTDKRLENAVADLDTSLTPGWWTSDTTLDPAQGSNVFKAEQKAVQELGKIKSPPADVSAGIDTLVEADRQLAGAAILASASAGGDPDEIARAVNEMNKASAELANGNPDKAISHYGNAWGYAQKAAPTPTTFTLHTCKTSDLTAAVQQADATTVPDTIDLKAGCTYTLTSGAYDANGPTALVITAPVTIHGNGATIARDSTAPPFRLFFAQASLALDHVTLTSGLPTGGGGGGAIASTVYDHSVEVAISHSTLSDNAAEAGGAITVKGSVALTLTGDSFSANTAGTAAGPGPGGAVFAGDGATATITDSSLTNNRAGTGSALAVWSGGTFSLARDTITGNTGNGPWGQCASGGRHSCFPAVDVQNTTVTILDSTIADNEGHGISNVSGGLSLVRTTIAGNFGSGIVTAYDPAAARQPHTTVADSQIAHNDVTTNLAMNSEAGWGGGIQSTGGGLVQVTGSTLEGNLARYGGAIATRSGPATTVNVANSTFTGNSAQNEGGGIYNSAAGVMNITNATFSGNQAGTGGGVFNLGTLTLRNTILATSTNGNCSGTIVDGGGNLRWPASDSSCVGAYGDPMLLPLADNGGPTQTMALGPGSGAIDAANDGICLAPIGPPDYGAGGVDQRGITRPQGAHCDIGAYELIP